MAIDINGDGLIAVGGTSTTQGRVRLAEDTDNGTNYVELTANAAITTNRTVTFPDENIDFTTGLSATLGGTGLTSAGTNGNVLTSNGTAWVSQAAAAGGGDYIMQAYTTPATWTKPAGLKAVKVTVIGAGGNGGTNNSGTNFAGSGGGGGGAILYLDAPGVPGPIAVTVGTAPSKTSSFGPLVSATGGTNGANAPPSGNAPQGPYAGGTGSGGTINVTGGHGYGIAYEAGARGGEAALGFGTPGSFGGAPVIGGNAYGGGGMASNNGGAVGGNGGAGIVIVEEFY